MDRVACHHRLRDGKLAEADFAARIWYCRSMKANIGNSTSETVWFVSRHPGAITWAKAQKLRVTRWVSHLESADVGAGDTVIGSLPVNLAARVCERGGRYLHLSIILPAHLRGVELSASEMDGLAVELRAFSVIELPVENPPNPRLHFR